MTIDNVKKVDNFINNLQLLIRGVHTFSNGNVAIKGAVFPVNHVSY